MIDLLPARPTPVVAIHPGANDPRRRWPPDAFAAVVAALVDEWVAVRIVGGPQDRAMAEQIRRRAERLAGAGGTSIEVVTGELDLGGTAALLAAADVLLANDSGPRHLAQAVGTSTVGIYWFGNVITAGR